MTETEVKQQTVGNGHEANAPALELTGKIIEQIEVGPCLIVGLNQLL